METKLKYLKAVSVSKLFKDKGIMYEIVKGYLNKINILPEYLVKTNEKNPNDFRIIGVLPKFYREIYTSFMNVRKIYQ